jgi:hypothetical protein
MIYRGPGFLSIVYFGYLAPHPPPSPVSKLDRRHIGRPKKRQLADREGGYEWMGEEPNHTTTRKPGPL